MMKPEKSIAQGIYEESVVEDGFILIKSSNDSPVSQYFKREVQSNYIQFHFSVKGQAVFTFNQGNYQLPLLEDHSLLLYNPSQELPMNFTLSPKSWMVTLLLSIKKLHWLFSNEAHYISFLTEENRDRKYYKDDAITPSMAIVLNQLMHYNLHPMVKPIYFKAKAYELLSLYFNSPEMWISSNVLF